jgi:hypothetical protein
VTFKITIKFMIDQLLNFNQMVILKATSFLEEHKSDTRGTCRITDIYIIIFIIFIIALFS